MKKILRLNFENIPFLRRFIPSFVLIVLVPFGTKAQTFAFTADMTEACSPTNIEFTDNSTGDCSLEWNFGNSNPSIQQNSSANYSDPDTYTLILTINGGPVSSQIKVDLCYDVKWYDAGV